MGGATCMKKANALRAAWYQGQPYFTRRKPFCLRVGSKRNSVTVFGWLMIYDVQGRPEAKSSDLLMSGPEIASIPDRVCGEICSASVSTGCGWEGRAVWSEQSHIALI